ncbi:MAG: hypothetical protein WAV05_02660 [Anaerolineales bacterium]
MLFLLLAVGNRMQPDSATVIQIKHDRRRVGLAYSIVSKLEIPKVALTDYMQTMVCLLRDAANEVFLAVCCLE